MIDLSVEFIWSKKSKST